MNTTDTPKMGYYVIKFVSESYTLQEETTYDIQIIPAGELVVKAQYLSCIQEKINWYWDHKNQQEVIIVPTQNFVHPCLDVVAVKYDHDIPKGVFNRNNSKQALQKHPIYLTEYDHDYIFEEIEHRDKIELEINSRDDGDEEYFVLF